MLFKLLNKIPKEITKKLKELNLNKNNSIIAFRGENKNFEDTALVPSLKRFDNQNINEEKLLDLVSDYSISNQSCELHRAIDAQHYISISRLLDITFDVLIAIYFASIGNEDGYLYIFTFPEDFSPNSDYMKKYYKSILYKDHHCFVFKDNFKVLTGANLNPRIKEQRGGFILFPETNGIIERIPECFYSKIEIKKSEKESILESLDYYFNLNESTIFPEKDKMKKVVIEKSIYKSDSDNACETIDEIHRYFEVLSYSISYKNRNKKFNIENKNELMRYFRSSIREFELSLNSFLENRESSEKESILKEFRKYKIFWEGTIENEHNSTEID